MRAAGAAGFHLEGECRDEGRVGRAPRHRPSVEAAVRVQNPATAPVRAAAGGAAVRRLGVRAGVPRVAARRTSSSACSSARSATGDAEVAALSLLSMPETLASAGFGLARRFPAPVTGFGYKSWFCWRRGGPYRRIEKFQCCGLAAGVGLDVERPAQPGDVVRVEDAGASALQVERGGRHHVPVRGLRRPSLRDLPHRLRSTAGVVSILPLCR